MIPHSQSPYTNYVLLILSILFMIGGATAAIYLSSSTSSTSRRIGMYVLIAVAVLALIGTVSLMFKLHQAVLLTPNTTVWFSLLIMSILLTLLTSIFSAWKVSKMTRQVLLALAGVGAVILSVSLAMIAWRVKAFKEQLAQPIDTAYPQFAMEETFS